MNRKVKVPIIVQLHTGENGTAALAMMLAYYKKYVPLDAVRRECASSRYNTSLRQMVKAAEKFDLSVETVNAPSLEEAKSLPLPYMIRDGKFYEIITGFSHGKVYINNPFRGREVISEEAFCLKLSGQVLLFAPSDSFTAEGKPESFFAPLISRFKNNKKACLTVMLFYLLSSASAVGIILLARKMMDDYISTGNTSGSGFICLAVCIVLTVNICSLFCIPVMVSRHGKEMAEKSGSVLYKKMLQLPMQFFESHFAGDLIDRVIDSIRLDKIFLQSVLTEFMDFLIVFVYLVILFCFNPMLSLFCILAEAVFVILIAAVKARIGFVQKSLAAMGNSVSSKTLSGINMIETIKTAGAEKSFFEQWCQAENAYEKNQGGLLFLNSLSTFLNEARSSFTQGLLFIVGAWMLIDGSLSFGGMAIFQLVLNQFEKNMQRALFSIDDYQKIKPNIDRAEDILARESEKRLSLNGESMEKLSGNISFRDVVFRYSKDDYPAVDGISFDIKRNEIIALVGKTGSGKSTILKLLSNLYSPQSGSILIDGRPVDTIPDAILKASIATVDQEVVIYPDTIRNNLKLWDEGIEDYEMILAANDAQIHQRIASSPDAYDSEIRENGKNFSGGELQRMTLARALASEPRILILDEFTSALDVITENLVFDAIRKRNSGPCILAAHRLSTVMLCDRVFVIDKGKIAEEGTPQELYDKNGLFRKLVDNG